VKKYAQNLKEKNKTSKILVRKKSQIMPRKTEQWPLAISYYQDRYKCIYDHNLKFDLEKKRRY